jgi:hypothetical protein
MMHLTRPGGDPVDIEKADIREVRPLGDGAILFVEAGPPVRVMQSASWIIALWKA